MWEIVHLVPLPPKWESLSQGKSELCWAFKKHILWFNVAFILSHMGKGMNLVLPCTPSQAQSGSWVEVTCESLRVNENPLNGLTLFLAQLQIDLVGAVGLGSSRWGGKRINLSGVDPPMRSH